MILSYTTNSVYPWIKKRILQGPTMCPASPVPLFQEAAPDLFVDLYEGTQWPDSGWWMPTNLAPGCFAVGNIHNFLV